MKIDGHSKQREAFRLSVSGKTAEGLALQREWLDEIIASGEDHCPCPEACPHHGNCFECVQIHRGHRDHLPYCFWDMINERIDKFSRITEGSFLKYQSPCPNGCGGCEKKDCPSQE